MLTLLLPGKISADAHASDPPNLCPRLRIAHDIVLTYLAPTFG